MTFEMTRVERAAPAVVWVLLMALVTWAYIPGLDGPMLLDDFVNLRPLERLELDSDFSADIIAGNRSGLTGRPISMASFTLERLYFDHGPYGQKVVGLVLHLVNATLVFLLSLRLFVLASLPRPQWPALIVASLWLSMPLLLSTTLYVVQRMTILSTLFTLLALLSYCEGRVRLMRGQTGWVWFPVTALCAVAAVLSKENGLLAVPLITLTEVFILGFKAAQQSTRRILLLFHSAAAVAAVLLLLVVLLLAPEYVVSGYERRDFTLIERLLTEGRVLLDYLKQMLWVDVHRLGVYHDDFPVSRGLLTPATTLWALAFWLLALAFVAWSAIKRRLLLVGFGVGFFMVGC